MPKLHLSLPSQSPGFTVLSPEGPSYPFSSYYITKPYPSSSHLSLVIIVASELGSWSHSGPAPVYPLPSRQSILSKEQT